MKLKEIKEDLEKMNYIIRLKKDQDLEFLQCSKPSENNKIIGFGIALKDGKIFLWDASQQKSTGILFNEKSDLIFHIKNHF